MEIISFMALYIIGLGLHDQKDITLKGLELIKKSDEIFLEYYTSKLACSIEDLEKLYGKKIQIADREFIEILSDEKIIKPAMNKNVSVLVIGDPFSATTHIDLMQRAKTAGVHVEIVNNASVLNAVGITGLELYKFGKTTSIPFDNDNITTPIEVFTMNKNIGLHTLFLLDLNPKENKYMKITEAINYLIKKGIDSNLPAIGLAELGSNNAEIKSGTLKKLEKESFNNFPQCLIIPGNLHFIEEEMLEYYQVK
jgi:diphthine synthase